MHENQISLQKEYEMYGEKNKNLRGKDLIVAEKNREEKRNEHSAIEVRKKRKTGMIAKAKNVRKALFSNQSLLVWFYKEVLITNELDVSLPSVITNLLQDYQDVFSEKLPSGLLPLRGIEYQIDLIPELHYPTKPHIGLNLRK